MWLVEARTVFGRARVRVLLGALAAVPILLAVAVYLSGGPGAGNGPAFLDRASHNGVFTALAGLAVTMPFFIPLSVAVVAGDAIAGEASLGTLRYLLVRPAGRARLLLAKGIVVALFCVVAALVVVVAGLEIARVTSDSRRVRRSALPCSPTGRSSPCRARRCRWWTAWAGACSPPPWSVRPCSGWHR